jgi:hypothetical protein
MAITRAGADIGRISPIPVADKLVKLKKSSSMSHAWLMWGKRQTEPDGQVEHLKEKPKDGAVPAIDGLR